MADVSELEPAPKPDLTYKVVCISMYLDDLEDLDAKVHELKQRGWTRMNRSMLLRIAMARLSCDDVGDPPRL